MVIQIEEHRGTLRDSLEQVAKFPEHVRAYDVAFVLGEHEARGALARVDVEVIEPEVGEHFPELPLAVHRAENLLLAKLDDDDIGALVGDGSRRRSSNGPVPVR